MDETIAFREQTSGNKLRKVVKAIRANAKEFLKAEVMQKATPIDAAKSPMPTLLDETARIQAHVRAVHLRGQLRADGEAEISQHLLPQDVPEAPEDPGAQKRRPLNRDIAMIAF